MSCPRVNRCRCEPVQVERKAVGVHKGDERQQCQQGQQPPEPACGKSRGAGLWQPKQRRSDKKQQKKRIQSPIGLRFAYLEKDYLRQTENHCNHDTHSVEPAFVAGNGSQHGHCSGQHKQSREEGHGAKTVVEPHQGEVVAVNKPVIFNQKKEIEQYQRNGMSTAVAEQKGNPGMCHPFAVVHDLSLFTAPCATRTYHPVAQQSSSVAAIESRMTKSLGAVR